MHEMTISMGTIEKVKRFVDIVSNYREQINLVDGNYVVNAKSIMSIFSMDLTAPILLKVDASEQRFKEIRNDLKEYAA
ncbi:MAG: HPr family phosphocarrier protein [Lachnospiraceae bacterium]